MKYKIENERQIIDIQQKSEDQIKKLRADQIEERNRLEGASQEIHHKNINRQSFQNMEIEYSKAQFFFWVDNSF